MNIGLIGYGKMGKIIHQLAEQRGHTVGNIVDVDRGKIDGSVDCYIDFSNPSATKNNVERCAELGIPLVLGTTGWGEQEKDIRDRANKAKAPIVYAGNFSLGVNLFLQTIAEAAKKFSAFADTYDVFVHEWHHKNKADSPSGTALQIGQAILRNHSGKTSIQTNKLDRKIEANELHISSTRGGAIPGTHLVTFDSDFDTIDLKHTARKRDGFALGAILTAEKIGKLKPGFHYLPDIFDQIFTS
ncbi:MAG: 4-hydroxy-tetrahydrodipicolinate reductase [Candidatus Gracilibacteria bacterium]|nr:4-hydroxy-tetrahydrodipicolinate reductase [Candidatus Gracilibacteria bacterium]